MIYNGLLQIITIYIILSCSSADKIWSILVGYLMKYDEIFKQEHLQQNLASIYSIKYDPGKMGQVYDASM